jgi:hypothetical protein
MAPGCMEHNYGQVVAAHSNSLSDGKGMGLKSHDIPAYLCDNCHGIVDGRIARDWEQRQREMLFYTSVYNTFLWLLQSGHLEVK